ncbi:MAG: DOPA 4,5-dioxygenase family protein [Pseudomonadota bacterium]
MIDTPFTGWHAHVYFDPEDEAKARALCETARDRFGVEMGRVHTAPIGPHPRGSCQLAVPPEIFGDVIAWLIANRSGLTVFAHGESDNAYADHTAHVLWLGSSETLDLSIFDRE